ncbi:LuxS/MPP-like metallohydrolase [Haematococcus lacustris]|uniref:LuxS/MPP-like metallohydrolase n=1 Tax=Haematococcus lacustris TaxID=44745 RepID=A0A699YHT2_HAELA|nr:LuxS/MPP-like metallohydrolase [Haematococcus lacustris]
MLTDLVELSNGLRVYLVEDHTVPLLRGSLLIRAGQWASPPDKVGLASAALNSLTLDFFCSSEDVQTVVQLFAEVLMSPAMPDDRLQLYKDQMCDTNPAVDDGAVANDWERPDAAVLGVVGDFSPLDMVSLLERQLGAWHPAPGQPHTPRKVQQNAEPLAPAAKHAGLLYVVDRPGLAQASVVVAEPGVRLEEPDSYPLEVLSTAFNSFGGQLFDQVSGMA